MLCAPFFSQIYPSKFVQCYKSVSNEKVFPNFLSKIKKTYVLVYRRII